MIPCGDSGLDGLPCGSLFGAGPTVGELRTKNWSFLVDPVVGARGGFFLVLVDVDLEALAIAFVLPVSDRVADAVEERASAEIKPPNEHASKMAHVANVVSR